MREAGCDEQEAEIMASSSYFPPAPMLPPKEGVVREQGRREGAGKEGGREMGREGKSRWQMSEQLCTGSAAKLPCAPPLYDLTSPAHIHAGAPRHMAPNAMDREYESSRRMVEESSHLTPEP